MKNILSIALAVLAISFAQAQDVSRKNTSDAPNAVESTSKPQGRKHGHHAPHHFRQSGAQKVENTELRQALEKYRAEVMMPAMKDEHKTMLKNLSRADRKFLEEKRQEHAQLRKKHHALRTAIHNARQQGTSKEAIAEQFKAQKEALHKERKAFYESMQEFVKRNETHLQSTRENLKTLAQKERENKKTTFEQFKPKDAPARPELKEGEKPAFPKRGDMEHKNMEKRQFDKGTPRQFKEGEKADFKGKHPKKHHHHGKKHHAHNKGDKFIQFLLWDGEVKEKAPTKSLEVPQATLQTSVYPNPAQNITTLKLDLPKDVKSVQIRVTDIQGKTVLTQTEKAMNAGTQNIQLNVEKLPSGTYFYNIIADDLKTGSSLIIAK